MAKKIALINPSTEEKFAEFEAFSKATILASYNKAKQVQVSWAKRSFAHRAQIIDRFKNLLLEESSLASVLSQEMGKPIKQAMSEIQGTAKRIEFFLQNAKNELESKEVFKDENIVEKITFEPLGVIVNISAWNFPYYVGTNVFIPALLAGNCVLYKPSELCLKTGFLLEELFKKADLPEGVFTSILGGKESGEHLLALKDLGGVFFTGSVGTGAKILQETSANFIYTNLEMGGKDPAYVTDEVDIEKCAENLVDGVFYNAGQSCCAVERIYVHKKVYDAFIASFVKHAKNIKMGDPMADTTYLGPIARKEQLDYLDDQIKDAVQKGGVILLPGGKKPEVKGFYYSPVVVGNCNSSMKLMSEESFGPVIGIEKVDSDDEALKKMNDNSFGLTASVHSTNKERANKMMEKLDFGTVYYNCCDRVSPYLPWSGRKNSGLGLTLSYLGIGVFLRPKAWHIKF